METNRNIKALALAFLAVFAMSAVAASAASATPVFFFESKHTILKGEEIVGARWVLDGEEILCPNASYNGSVMATTTTEVVFAVEYSNCESTQPFGSVSVEMNGCTLPFKLEALEEGNYVGTEGVQCAWGSEITVRTVLGGVTKCLVHIPPQTGLGTIVYDPIGWKGTSLIQFESNVFSGLKYSKTEGTGFGKCATADGTGNGAYEATVAVRGYDTEGKRVGIGIE